MALITLGLTIFTHGSSKFSGEIIMKKALIIIDYINDFVQDDGKLTCGKPAQDIDETIEKIVHTFKTDGDFIIVASDSHEKGDIFNPEHALFPEHCVCGTDGCELFGKN